MQLFAQQVGPVLLVAPVGRAAENGDPRPQRNQRSAKAHVLQQSRPLVPDDVTNSGARQHTHSRVSPREETDGETRDPISAFERIWVGGPACIFAYDPSVKTSNASVAAREASEPTFIQQRLSAREKTEGREKGAGRARTRAQEMGNAARSRMGS